MLGVRGEELADMDVEMLVVIGGDGTMLRTFMRTDLPLLGINAGDVGFLTEAGPSDMEDVVERIRSGKYRIEERIRMRATVNNEVAGDAVNEAVIHSASIGKVRHFRLNVGMNSVGLVKADGIIFSTPTGSTSYALSAGGPIVDPSATVFVIVPLAPYGISSRPIVCSPESVIRVEIEGGRACRLVIDGQKEQKLSGDETIRFTVSPNSARFVRFDYDFYRRIRTKLTG